MEILATAVIISQLIFTIIAGVYFYSALKTQRAGKIVGSLESSKEMERMKKMRAVRLTTPLSEKTRPKKLEQIVGQEEGIKALRAAFCGKNPQHIIIYGPPGIGKTAAARLMLEEAKRIYDSPFKMDAPFIEMDATTLRFDERSVADPLMGSVHDPIYQGAGAYGAAGVPQPKEGAVTKAHGGVLFMDEIGELHPVQMNKLLKVLEDRRVFLSSSYYNSENKNIPKHVHDVFQNGLPADFRLVGATTRLPEELPIALRSRCTEIYFDGLKRCHIKQIAQEAAKITNMDCEADAAEKVTCFATNGRDAVNIMQTAASVAGMDKRKDIRIEDIEWVVQSGRYSPRMDMKIAKESEIGLVNGLAVCGSGGTILPIEAWAKRVEKGCGELKVTGIVEDEEIKNGQYTMKRKSTASSSVSSVITVFCREFNVDIRDYDVHINFTGGIPVDGPSAGAAIFSALYSAVNQKIMPSDITMTGEVSIFGRVLPVGGVPMKIEGAIEAGAKRVIIPRENYQTNFSSMGIEILCVNTLDEVLSICFGETSEDVLTA